MMDIQEVSNILNSFGLLSLLAPEHVFLTDERIVERMNGDVHFRGLAPKKKRGTIILSRDADHSTVPHEVAHSAFGVGERLAYPFGSVMQLRYQLRTKLPILKGRLNPFKVQYKEADVPLQYAGRVEHYIKVR